MPENNLSCLVKVFSGNILLFFSKTQELKTGSIFHNYK